MTQPNGHSDEEAQAELDKVELVLFTVTPDPLAPFFGATLQWEVKVPRAPDLAVSILLDGDVVAASGEMLVAPPVSQTYTLGARAASVGRQLGQVTAEVDLDACTTKVEGEMAKIVAGVIEQAIKERTDGVYLSFVLGPNPLVAIRDGSMSIHLVLGKKVPHFPDPTITIDASFGLAVVPGPPPSGRFVPPPFPGFYPPVLAPADEVITTDCSFPWYAWLVPVAPFVLPIVESGAEADAYKDAESMIDDIVTELLNPFFPTPQGMWKHNAAFYVDEYGGEFSVTFCPIPRPTVEA